MKMDMFLELEHLIFLNLDFEIKKLHNLEDEMVVCAGNLFGNSLGIDFVVK